MDFELLCDFDLISTNDTDFIQSRLKDMAKRLWEAASKKAAIRPAGGKSQTGAAKPITSGFELEEDKRQPGSFDLGMMIPNGIEHFSDRRVLDAKKEHFGDILRANEELRNIELELRNVDPGRISSVQIIEVCSHERSFLTINF